MNLLKCIGRDYTSRRDVTHLGHPWDDPAPTGDDHLLAWMEEGRAPSLALNLAILPPELHGAVFPSHRSVSLISCRPEMPTVSL